MKISHPYVVTSNLIDARRNGVLTDLTITVEERSFQLHKVVLAASSPYFRALLTNNMAETYVSSLEVHDVAAETFEEVLNFMYTGVANLASNIQAVWLIAAAEKFLMSDLSHITFQCLKEHAGVVDFPELLAEGRRLGLRDIEAFAFARCLEHFEEQVETEPFLALPPEFLLELLESDFLMTDNEEIVVKAAVGWIAAPVPEPSNRHEVWPKIFDKLHLRGMKPDMLPRLWPTLEPYCSDEQCRRLLWSFSAAEARSSGDPPGPGDAQGSNPYCNSPSLGPRWLMRKTADQKEQLEMAEQLFNFALSQPEQSQLAIALLVKKNDKEICREVINLTQEYFEKVVSEKREAREEQSTFRGVLFLVADLISCLIRHNILIPRVIREKVLEELHSLDSDEARMQLCTLSRGLLCKREEEQHTWGGPSEPVTMAILRLAEIAELEISRTASPWLKLELQETVRKSRAGFEVRDNARKPSHSTSPLPLVTPL